MRALREFSYRDFAGARNVTVPAGAELSPAALADLRANKLDVEKLVRTKYMDQESLSVTPAPKRRGRPRKS